MSGEARDAVTRLCEAFKESAEYKEYKASREEMDKDPSVARKVDELRKRYFALLQSGNEDGGLYYRQKELMEENKELLSLDQVERFYRAEVDYTWLVREVEQEFMRGIL